MLKLFRFLKPYIPSIVAVFFLTFFQAISELYLPTLMSDIVDNGIVNGDTDYILTVGGRMLVIALLGMVCAVFSSLLSSRTSSGFGKLLRSKVFSRVESFSLQEFERFGTASLITRTTNDITQLQHVVMMMMRMMLRAPMMCIGGIIMAVSKDPVLSLGIFSAIPLLAMVIMLVSRKGMPLFKAMQLKLDRLNLVLRERLTGIRVIRAFNRTDYEKRRFNEANRDLTETAVRVNKIMALLMPAMSLILNYTIIAIIWFGSIRIDHGYMQVGDLMAFIQYVGLILFSMMMLSMIFVIIPRASVSAARINEVLETECSIKEPLDTGGSLPKITKPIAVRGIKDSPHTGGSGAAGACTGAGTAAHTSSAQRNQRNHAGIIETGDRAGMAGQVSAHTDHIGIKTGGRAGTAAQASACPSAGIGSGDDKATDTVKSTAAHTSAGISSGAATPTDAVQSTAAQASAQASEGISAATPTGEVQSMSASSAYGPWTPGVGAGAVGGGISRDSGAGTETSAGAVGSDISRRDSAAETDTSFYISGNSHADTSATTMSGTDMSTTDISAADITETDTSATEITAADTSATTMSATADASPADSDTSATDPDKPGAVRFDNVTFCYPGAEKPAVSGVSFCAKPGEVTAIIGGTGSGKSTLLKLILRFYDVDSGRILIDNQDIREMPIQALRAKIGYVPQRSVLFTGTIAENLRYGKEDASTEEIQRALELAQADEFVSQMADGIDSFIEQGGINVSGGQKQRLSIARALIRKPEIYLFDDCFSALDFKTDARLRKALKKETANSTMIIVAQRVSTVIDADQIVVLDEGKVVGVGKHRELLDKCRVYREIVSSQMSLEELA